MNIKRTGVVLRGVAMGIAEVIPGVSGGTIAFITGIYRTLIDSITAVDIQFIKMVLKGDFHLAAAKINFGFLMSLFFGMVGGLILTVFGVSYLLENYPEPLWGFFFGLILASIPLMLSQLTRRQWSYTLIFILGAVVAYGVTSLSPVPSSTNYFYIYFAGCIAICALVLPGISGSFILLLLGLYSVIVPGFKSFLQSPSTDEFLILAAFGLGCITGLAVISRIVKRAFEKYKNHTLALLSGFMLGSLNKIWPWRNIRKVLDETSGQIVDVSVDAAVLTKLEKYKILFETNVLPQNYSDDPKVLLVILSFIAGLALIYSLSRYELMTGE